MGKIFSSRTLYMIGLILLGCFIISSAYDCYKYYFGEYQYYSSPLYLYIALRALTFLLPAIVSIVIAHVVKSKYGK